MDKRVKRTKKIIKNGVYKYYVLNKEYNLSITELCKRININRTTFYLHYATFDDVIYEMQDEILESLSYILERKSSTDEKILIISNFVKENDRGIVFLFEKIDDRIFSKIRTLVEPEINKTIPFNYVDETAYEYAISFIITGSIAVYKKWINNNCEGDITFLLNNLNIIFDK